jgi:putative membrane protein
MFSGTVLLTCVAFAQMHPGAGSPSQSNPPNSSNPAGSDTMQAPQGDPASDMTDKAFVKKALEGGLAEVQLGQLAAQKGTSDDVKQFGQKMVDDHTKLGDQMKLVAAQVGVKVPTDVSKKDKELMAKMEGLSGTQFDNAYIEAMVKDHKKDASDFKSEAQQSHNSAVQQAAQQGDQVIEQHLQMIQQIAQNHNLMNSKGKMTSSGQ